MMPGSSCHYREVASGGARMRRLHIAQEGEDRLAKAWVEKSLLGGASCRGLGAR